MKILKVKCLAPTRLDNYLTQQYPALTPGRLNKALRENKIKLNGKKQPLSTRVMAGDEIKLFILDEILDADRRVDGPAWKNARGPAQVVYDCPQIVIVNKPAGLAVDGPEDDTLLNRTLLYLNQQGEYKENDLYTPALCHRLDTGTSGLVIVAKTPEAEELFLAAIKNREVKKTYLCVTFGRPMPPDATLGGYLLKDADRGIVKIVEEKQPDVVLLDIRMPEMDGVECTRRIKQEFPGIKVIILTTFDDDDYVFDALRYGASGYLLKGVSVDGLTNAVREAARGGSIIAPDVASKVLQMFSRMAQGDVQVRVNKKNALELTKMEWQVIREVGCGLSNKEIAGRLYLSEGTVRNYISSILRKLELRDRTQLAIWAVQNQNSQPKADV